METKQVKPEGNNSGTNQGTNNSSLSYTEKRLLAAKVSQLLQGVNELGYKKVGVLYDEKLAPDGSKQGLIHVLNPYEDKGIQIITIPTYAKKEEVEAIKESIINTPEAAKILFHLARCKASRQIAVIIGDTALGKSFIVEKFTELLFGQGVKPETLDCQAQTEVSEIMGKYVPWKESQRAREMIEDFRSSTEGKEQIKAWREDPAKPYGELKDIEQIKEAIAAHLGLEGKQSWNYQFGALPRAAVCHRLKDSTGNVTNTIIDGKPGPGTVLHLQELSRAHPGVLGALFSQRGYKGQITKSFQVQQDGGMTIRSGEDFFIVATMNPTDIAGFQAVNELDKALEDSMDKLNLGTLSKDSAKMYVNTQFREAFKELKDAPNCYADLSLNKELIEDVVTVVTTFHLTFNEDLKEGEKNSRGKKVQNTFRALSMLARFIASNQVLDQNTFELDLAGTVLAGIKTHYLELLSKDNEVSKQGRNETQYDKLLRVIKAELYDASTSNLKLNGKAVSRADYWAHLIKQEESKLQNLESVSEEVDVDDPELILILEELKAKVAGATTSFINSVESFEKNSEITDEAKQSFVNLLDLASNNDLMHVVKDNIERSTLKTKEFWLTTLDRYVATTSS